MEGKYWKFNPFFRLGLRRLSRHQANHLLSSYRYRLNPFNWSKRTIRVFTASFFLIMLPIYLYIGFQPVDTIGALGYPTLEITSLGLSTSVATLELQDHQLIAPDTIAGAYSQNINKTLIIGHSSTVFQTLDHIEVGAQLTYADKIYRVSDYRISVKTDIKMSQILAPAEQDTLIIMTCAGETLPNQDATHRLIITAILDDEDYTIVDRKG